MKCVICKNGNTNNENVTLTLELNGKVFIFKDVPARVCGNCGEQYLEEETSRRLLGLAHEASKLDTELTITRFKAA
jgi:YgiT-type zinc finger domain-containing protein